MNSQSPHRLLRILWVGALATFVALSLFPVSNRLTRTSGLALGAIVWTGLIALCWKRRVIRNLLLGITTITAVFLALPARSLPAADSLRADYIDGLQRYDGVTYYWGGESPMGIDCSGLIRRGLIDSLFCRGIRTCDPGLVRRALAFWWNDTTASELGRPSQGITTHLLDTPSINQLDHSRLLPGDLAVTGGGAHILAYLGNERWIEADPAVGRVITVAIPSHGNVWFEIPVSIVRWGVLAR